MNWRSSRLIAVAFVCATGLACSKNPDAIETRKSLDDTFGALISKYELAVAREEVARDSSARPILRGRLLAVREPESQDGNYMKYDLFPDGELLELMPSELRATTPDEVRTLLHVSCTEESIGSYSDGSTAYVWNCTVGVVDLETGKLALVGSYRGPAPPKSVNAGGTTVVHGDKPYKAMAQAILRLPRQ